MVSLITGATRGIGKAIALELASKGSDIVANYRKMTPEIEELQKEIESKGVQCLLVQADISDFEQTKNIVAQAMEKFGKIDVLVNNAGITKDNLLMRMSEEDFDAVINTNLKGTFNMIKHVTPIMMKQKSGRIINMSSVVGVMGNAGQVNYSASKAGVIGITKSLAREVASRGILVNAIAPGFIETSMTDVLSDSVKENILTQIPLKRMGKAEEIAKLVAFLVSEDCKYITGQVISIDGGMNI